MSVDDPTTPFEVEREMVELNSRIMKSPSVIKEYHNAVREAKAKLRNGFNVALVAQSGSTLNAQEKRAQAEMQVEDLQHALDVAEVEYRYVVDLHDALKTKLRGLQSISSLMKAAMFTPSGGI